MIIPKTFILPLLALLVTPILSAPITISGHSLSTATNHAVHANLVDQASFLKDHYHGSDSTTVARRAVQSRPLVARDEPTVMLESRSSDDIAEQPLAKRAEDATPLRLVKRKSIAAKIRDAFKKVGQKIKSGFQKVGKAFKNVGQKIKSGFQTAGRAIKKGFQKAGTAIKKAAQKVGHFIKTTGAKIAKFGLKIYATATKIASKVAGFIPGVGKVIGKALSGASRVANLVSDKIHVSLGKKLDKGIRVMNTIQNPIKGAAGKALDAILKRDMESQLTERDLMDGEELFERDLPELDARSFDDEELFERNLLEMEPRSFEDELELEARSLEDLGTLKAHSIFRKDRS